MRRLAAAGAWLALSIAAEVAGSAHAANAIQSLVQELSRQTVEEFPVLEGAVVGADGVVLEVAFPGEPRIWTPNVEILRPTQTAGLPALRRIGLGKLIGLDGHRANIEIVSSDTRILLGDRVRTSAGLLGICVVPVIERQDRRELLGLIAIRMVRELELSGRFHAELAAGSAARPEMDAWLWRGLQYSLLLSYVEEDGEATLLARLQSLRSGKVEGVFSARAPAGEGWNSVLAALGGGAPEAGRPVEHSQAGFAEQAAALHVLEVQERTAVLALTRDALHLFLVEDGGLRQERVVPLPRQTILGRGSRDFLGAIVPERDGRLRVGHSLLASGLAFEMAAESFEILEPGVWLGEQDAALFATLRPGANRLEGLRLGGGEPLEDLAELRFAAWLGPSELLIQTADYRLWIVDPASGSRRAISRSSGAGVSLLAGSPPLVAASAQRIVEGSGGPSESEEADRITVSRLESGRLEVIWQSDPIPGPIRATALGMVRGRLQLAAFESGRSGQRLHLYSDLPIPQSPVR